MGDIKVVFRDGSVRNFPLVSRHGGSYSQSVRYEGEFVIITNVWGKEFSFPASIVSEVESRPIR